MNLDFEYSTRTQLLSAVTLFDHTNEAQESY